MEDDEAEEEEDDIPTPKPKEKSKKKQKEVSFKIFEKTDAQRPWLNSHFPKSTKKADITKFIADYIKKLTTKEKAKLDLIMKDLEQAWSNASTADKATIQDKAYKWGLSMTKIVNASTQQLRDMIGFSILNNMAK